MIYLLFGYIYLALHRPMEIWPTFEPLRIELVYFGMLCVAWLVAPKRLAIDLPKLAIAVFTAAVYAAWLLSPWSASGEIPVKNFTLAAGFALIMATCLRDERALRRVIVAFLAVMTLYMLHSIREYLAGRFTYRMGISRLIGVDTSLGDPNTFAASILYTLPFVRYLWMEWPSRKGRTLLTGYVLLSIGCIGLTGSRSALVGLTVWALVTIRLSGKRRLPLLAFASVAAVAGFMVLPDELQNRFTTIIDPSVGPENARESGQGRIEGFFIGMELWSKYPLTGVGPGAWRPATGRAIESHNLYGQLVGELGTFGALAFGVFLFAVLRGLRQLFRLVREHVPDPGQEPVYHLAQALTVCVFLLLFEGVFGHNLYRYNYLWYCAFVSVALRAYRQRVTQSVAEIESEQWVPAWA
ncbi:MAG: O-antigen ligase family protein [Gemmataceae bacterium]